MPNSKKTPKNAFSNILLPESTKIRTRPIWFASSGSLGTDLEGLTKEQRAWLHATGWKPTAGKVTLLADAKGELAGAVFGLGDKGKISNVAFSCGSLPRLLPPGAYHFESELEDADKVTLFWLLGSYTFSKYSAKHMRSPRHLKLPDGVDDSSVLRRANAVVLGRDLINTPAEDMGPAELEKTVEHIAETHGADLRVTVGDHLLNEDFPLIHAVGRASDREPRLIDLTWGESAHPKVTLVGKGICFDTGGLNIKPGNSMTLMKKDMGGAATAIALASMIISEALPVRLRLLIPTADNNISANAFRPGDVYESRKGLTVEIGNTDAEGRLVLADALALANEEKPDYLFNFATLTGAARVALGADLPPYYTNNDALAEELAASAEKVCDPLWRMPLWSPYREKLNSKIADINHIADNSFAGSITAALFLKEFAPDTDNFVHLDIYGWSPKTSGPKITGGEPQGARAVFAFLKEKYANA